MNPSPIKEMISKLVSHKSINQLILIWLGWIVIIFLFQGFVYTRFQLQRPDTVMDWTSEHTRPENWHPAINLTNLFLYSHVAWDSNYYVSIAENGYGNIVKFTLPSGDTLTTDYAFLPFYPLVIHIISLPLLALGYSADTVIPLCGLIISLLGTLAGLISLYDISRKYLKETIAFRTAFYLLIFPTSIFLAQVYSEGLFIGLTFTCLALIERKKYLPAAILAAFATWTRTVGILLAIPIALPFISEWLSNKKMPSLKSFISTGIYSLLPALAYGIWRFSWLGKENAIVENYYYGRGILEISKTWDYFKYAVHTSLHNPQTASYYGIEFGIIFLGLLASLYTFNKYPGISLFSFIAILFSVFSGVLISQSRYVLSVPSLFLFLGELGKSDTFDRLFTIASILLLAVFLILFTFRFWVA